MSRLYPGGYLDHIERQGRSLRSVLTLNEDVALCPFQLARALGIRLLDPRDLVMPQESLERLLGESSEEWDAVTVIVPERGALVILNPKRGQLRQRSTLMEEISHLFLRHRPSKIFLNSPGNIAFRGYHEEEEREAYYVAGASLLPYESIKNGLMKGRSIEQIAEQFQVTPQLVKFRVKTTRLWHLYKQQASRQ